MRLPRDLGGEELARLLRKNEILREVAAHLDMERDDLLKSLFS